MGERPIKLAPKCKGDELYYRDRNLCIDLYELGKEMARIYYPTKMTTNLIHSANLAMRYDKEYCDRIAYNYSKYVLDTDQAIFDERPMLLFLHMFATDKPNQFGKSKEYWKMGFTEVISDKLYLEK